MDNYEKDLFSCRGKVVIVTGAAGQLGGEFSRAFLRGGAKVAGFDIAPDNPKGRLNRIKSKKFISIKVDITEKESIERGLKEVIKRLGMPNVLINNAALDVPPGASGKNSGPFETYPKSLWEATMDVNLKGMFLCCQVIGSHMSVNKGGSIINISSIYGILSPDHSIYKYKKEPFFKPVDYSVSKAGVLNLTRYLAVYWAKKKVRVNSLSLAGVFNNQDRKFLEGYVKKVPLGRMAKADEYNAAVLFLASDASSYMTGSNMIIDGGYSAW